MKILVVEDEAPIRDLISINLQLVGYEVFTAEDGITTKTYEVSVVVLPETIIIQEVKILPNEVEIEQGKSYKFKSTVVVNEVEDLSHSVTWTIEGNNSIDTIINANGEISIAEN